MSPVIKRGTNPAVRTRIPILVRVRLEGAEPNKRYVFTWYLRRRIRGTWGWKHWRAYVSTTDDFREALAGYRDYAEYWRTGTW